MKKTAVEKHFDDVAKDYDVYTKKRDLHYSTLKRLLTSLIPPKKKILEIGCGTGDLLASLNPRDGYGVDISSKMIKIARSKYGHKENLRFSIYWPEEKFEYIFMSDVIEHLENPLKEYEKISNIMNDESLFINTMMNPVWIPVESVYNFFGWKMPEGPHRRIRYEDIKKICYKVGLKVVKHDYKLLMPIKVLLITSFMNRYLEKYFKKYAFIEYFIAKKK